MADIIFLVLLFVHIGTVVLWMGASILYVSVLGPSIGKLAPSSRADLMKTIGSAYEKYIVRNATIAVVAGLILYAYVTGRIVSVSSNIALGNSGMPWILAGIIFGFVAYVIGIFVVMRSNRKLMQMMGQTPTTSSDSGTPSGEMKIVQRRLAMGAGLQALFLMLALLSMVVGANI